MREIFLTENVNVKYWLNQKDGILILSEKRYDLRKTNQILDQERNNTIPSRQMMENYRA